MDPVEFPGTSLTRALGRLDAAPGGAAPGALAAGPSFGVALKDALQSISTQQAKANDLQRRFQLNDPNVGLEETMVAAQTASLSFQALVQVRNRLVSAYQEIMNLNV